MLKEYLWHVSFYHWCLTRFFLGMMPAGFKPCSEYPLGFLSGLCGVLFCFVVHWFSLQLHAAHQVSGFHWVLFASPKLFDRLDRLSIHPLATS